MRNDVIAGFTAVVMVVITVLAQKPFVICDTVCCPDNFAAMVTRDTIVLDTFIAEQFVIYKCAFIIAKLPSAAITDSYYFFLLQFLQNIKIPIRYR